MDPDAAKATRTSAKRVFTRKRNRVVQSIEEELEPEIVNQGFDSLRDSWSVVQTAQEDYVKDRWIS